MQILWLYRQINWRLIVDKPFWPHAEFIWIFNYKILSLLIKHYIHLRKTQAEEQQCAAAHMQPILPKIEFCTEKNQSWVAHTIETKTLSDKFRGSHVVQNHGISSKDTLSPTLSYIQTAHHLASPGILSQFGALTLNYAWPWANPFFTLTFPNFCFSYLCCKPFDFNKALYSMLTLHPF